MFTIRPKQVEVLEQAATKRFEDNMVGHLCEAFKDEYLSVGEIESRGIIQQGIRRSRIYGIAIERDVCKFIEVMFILGRDFDQDPQYAWARATLTDLSFKYPADRINAVREKLKDLA